MTLTTFLSEFRWVPTRGIQLRNPVNTTCDTCIVSVALCLLGMVTNAADAASQGEPQPVGTALSHQEQIYKPWRMHHVCRDFLIANSLNAADVDGDGDLDLLGNGESITTAGRMERTCPGSAWCGLRIH